MSSNPRNQAMVEDGKIVVQTVQGRQNMNQRTFGQGNAAAGNGGGMQTESGMPFKGKEGRLNATTME